MMTNAQAALIAAAALSGGRHGPQTVLRSAARFEDWLDERDDAATRKEAP